jgi:hypothetical protein
MEEKFVKGGAFLIEFLLRRFSHPRNFQRSNG